MPLRCAAAQRSAPPPEIETHNCRSNGTLMNAPYQRETNRFDSFDLMLIAMKMCGRRTMAAAAALLRQIYYRKNNVQLISLQLMTFPSSSHRCIRYSYDQNNGKEHFSEIMNEQR